MMASRLPKARATARAPGRAKMADPEPDQQPAQRLPGRGRDAGDEIGGGEGGETLEGGQLLHRQLVEIGGVGDQPGRHELEHALLAQPLDVHGRAGGVSGRCAGRAGPGTRCWCSRCRSPPPTGRVAPRTTGTRSGTSTWACAASAPRTAEYRADDLGNDVTRLAHDHQVAGPHVLGLDLVLVVQGGHPDRWSLRRRRARAARRAWPGPCGRSTP